MSWAGVEAGLSSEGVDDGPAVADAIAGPDAMIETKNNLSHTT
jgi:hypothetical protein